MQFHKGLEDGGDTDQSVRKFIVDGFDAKVSFLFISLLNADEIICAFEVKFGEELLKDQGDSRQRIKILKILESDSSEALVIYAGTEPS